MEKNKKNMWGIIILGIGLLLLICGGILFLSTKEKQVNNPTYADSFSYEYVAGASSDYVVISNDGKYGYAKVNGEEVIPISYKLPYFSDYYKYLSEKDGLFVYTDDNDLFGLVDKDNKVVLKANYTDITIIDKNTFIVGNEEGKFSLVNAKGEKISEEYDFFIDMDKKSEIFIVFNNEHYGLVNKSGEVIVSLDYNGYEMFDEDDKVVLLFIGEDKLSLYLYDNELFTIDDNILGFSNLKNDSVYYLNSDNKLIKYDLKLKSKTEDATDNEVIEENYMLEENEKVAYFDKDNNALTEYKYDAKNSKAFDGNYAIVGIDDKLGVINKEGKEIVPVKYNSISINNSLILAVDDNNSYLLDSNGGILTTAEVITYIEEKEIYVVLNKERYSLLDKNGNSLDKNEYINYNYVNGYIMVQNGLKKWILVK